MSMSYFIETTILVEPTREVFINIFERALKLDAQLDDSPAALAEKMMEELSTPNGHSIARAWCGFIVKGELAGFRLYCGLTSSGMLIILFSIQSRKVYYDEDEEGYGTCIDFNWYLKKIMFMTESYGIGYLEARMSNDIPMTFEKWEVWAQVSGGHRRRFLWELDREPSTRTEEDKSLIIKRCNEMFIHLMREGYGVSPVNIEDVAKNEKSIVFNVAKEQFEVQITIRKYYVYLNSLNEENPRNIRAYVDLLYTICKDDCVYRYYACNGRQQDVSS